MTQFVERPVPRDGENETADILLRLQTTAVLPQGKQGLLSNVPCPLPIVEKAVCKMDEVQELHPVEKLECSVVSRPDPADKLGGSLGKVMRISQ